ncbi:uncharacterized protein PAC_06957 [Phialocephala subalpina]|uniref:Velvet domain-containing protein n=1 Tax=Phialocephala subalpina TaxID=576137 RepID=A0A1L7WWB5_9HELO|nr:uncharacterized protein PAC_06957 [Phialocephala subalpina]
MNSVQSTHQFAEAQHSQVMDLPENACMLVVRQQPKSARVAVGKEKDRKPVDPPPIIQLKINTSTDPHQNYLQIQFNLYQMQHTECVHVASTTSESFPVVSTKNFTGMAESTFLTRTFSDQGVRLRLRKEPRTLLRKRGPADDNYEPRTYNKSTNRSQSNGGDRQPVTSPESQDSNSQTEQSDVMTAHSHPFDQRLGLQQRQYSEQSSTTYSSNSYEDSMKRPRTGSDQSQASSFGHQNQVIESRDYSGRTYADSPANYNTYGSQLSQNPNYFTAGFSPTQTRDYRENQFMMPKLNTQMGNASTFDHRSPSSSYFPPQVQSYQSPVQQGHFSSHMMPTPGTQRSQYAQNALAELGLSRPQSTSTLGGMSTMGPPMSSMRTSTQMGNSLPQLPFRRESFQSFSDVNQNLSAGVPAIYPVRTASSNPGESPSVEGHY